MNDERLIEASKDALRVIVRRPHAYKFRKEHGKAPIPGLVVLDAEGVFVGGVALPSKGAVEKAVGLLKR